MEMAVRLLIKGCRLQSPKALFCNVRNSSSVLASNNNNFLWPGSNHERKAKQDLYYNRSCKRYASRDSIIQAIAESKVVELAQTSLNFIHESTHLPWWAVIVVATVGVRTSVTFPLIAYQYIVLARYANLEVELRALVAELKKETGMAVQRFKWDEKTAKAAYYRSFRKLRKGLIERDNCHPFKGSLVIWFQVPIWVILSFALRNILAGAHTQGGIMAYLSIATEGTLWFTNLTVPDPYFILPILMGLVNLSIVEFHALKSVNPSRFQKGVTWFFRGVCLVLVPIGAIVPSGLTLYWLTSSSVGLCHNVLLTAPRLRRAFRIPPTPGESEAPFRQMWEHLQKRIQR